MTDLRSQLEAHKAAASSFQAKLQHAKTKDEALTLAISVAENLMEAIKLSQNPAEKKELRSHCRSIMEVADRIKSAVEWSPPGLWLNGKGEAEEPSRPAVNAMKPTQSAATENVGASSHMIANDLLVDLSSAPSPALPSTAAADKTTHVVSRDDATPASSNTTHARDTSKPVLRNKNPRGDTFGSLIDFSKRHFSKSGTGESSRLVTTLPKTAPQPGSEEAAVVEPSPALNSSASVLDTSTTSSVSSPHTTIQTESSPGYVTIEEAELSKLLSAFPASHTDTFTATRSSSGGFNHYNLAQAGKPLPSVTDAIKQDGQQEFVEALEQSSQRLSHPGSASLPVPPPAAQSRVRRLKEPMPTRKRSKREDILLLKASVLHGFKFPPWDKDPNSPEFVLQDGSPIFSDHELPLSTHQQQYLKGWVRASEALPPPSMFPNNRKGLGPLMKASRSMDLVQDAATDCSVVASMCAGIARTERGHDQMLSNMIWPYDQNRGTPVLSPNGKYIVRLNFNGCWRKVVIDDRLPLSVSHRLIHVIDRRNPALLWPALLEKAYLKVRGGYDFPGSNSCSDLWTLTGWIPEEIYLQETDIVPDQLWERIYKAFLYGDILVTVGTGKMTHRQERELGLEGQHSYVVLDMRETDHDKLLLVKNPWAEGRGWRGPQPPVGPVVDKSLSSDSSDSLYRGPTEEQLHPSTFWIPLGQLIQNFERLYLNWNPGLFSYRQDVHFEWKIESPKGANICIVKHPQFSFSSKGAGQVWLLLSRHFRDTPPEEPSQSDAFNDGSVRSDTQMYNSGDVMKGYTTIFVCNGNGERIYIKDAYLECGPYVNTPQCLLKWEADADSTYTVVIAEDELPASNYTFTLSAFSHCPIDLEPATEKYPFQMIEQGAWTKQTAGGDTSSPRYFENPQYTLEVRERCSLAILLTSANHPNPLHAKLALGYGKRLYKLQSRDVITDTGDYRDGCAFAETVDLQPGLYTIICSLFEPGQTGDYTLRVDSTRNIVLKQIPRDGAGLLSTQLSPACFGPDVHKVAAPLIPRRLASYTIVTRFLKATSPRSHDLGMLSRSPLRMSLEIGRGPDRKFVMTSERGEYADTPIVRSESVDLDPTYLNQGDLWLVLDRLSGPGGPVEEWYEVEMFVDMPNAYTIGVWRNWDD